MVAHGDKKSSKVVGRRVAEMGLPKGASVGAIVRKQEILISYSKAVIEPDDHVIVFVSSRTQISKVEKLFQVSASFF